MLDHYYAVIMAGGGGTRLWPLSRKKRPKQMLALFDERTLFQTAVQRVQGVFPPERILVVTVEEQAQELRAQSPDIPPENFLIERVPRGTASVVGLAAVAVRARDPQAVMAILASDHYIGNEPFFRKLLEAAYEAAADDYLVTLGIEPTFPATGFGYIQSGEKVASYLGLDVYNVLRFKEKPNKSQAAAMLLGGDHSWNSGMFVWKVDLIMQQFALYMPELTRVLEEVNCCWGQPEQWTMLEELWPKIKPETIDYGIMEHASRVVVIPATGLQWSDVGSWDSLFEVLEHDQQGNIIMGGSQVVGLETRQTLVYVEEGRRLIVTIGVENLVLVDTGDVLLVCHKDHAQGVRQVVDRLKLQGQNYL
jgi:mannose-1-phosphate guanylyltransferase